MKKCVAAVVVLFAFAKANLVNAQEGLGEAITDLVFIIDGFTQPASEAGVLQTSAGWYYEAKSLDLFEFSLSANIGGLTFPKAKQTFGVQNSDFLNLSIRNSDSAQIPTALGGNERVFFDFDINNQTYEFQTIGGLDTDFFAFPFIQGQVGLWKETELSVRYGPKIEIQRASYALFGAGIKHNLSQYLFKENRPFELAFIANYSLVDLNIYFDRLELAARDGSAPIAVLDGYLADFQAVTVGLIGSKQAGNWVFSGGVNYNASWLDYSLLGEESSFLDLFNSSLEVLSERTYTVKLDAGIAYKFNSVDLYTQASSDFDFLNLNIGVAYRFN